MNQTIPSSHVGVKINEWYKMIRQFSIPDAEILKAEVEQEIQQMEEDQDLLIYYSLMCFRHQLMLDYLEPGPAYGDRPTVTELLETIETPQKKLTGLLKYYSLFFRGMYEFGQKEYVEAIGYYRLAEKELTFVTDEIEEAEFHFKLAEAYYNMKQTHVSMHHVLKAIEIYNRYDLYKVRKIQCMFLIAGNYDDLKTHEKALKHLNRALELSQEINNLRLISSSYYNLGNCYDFMGKHEKAVHYYEKAVLLGKQEKLDTLPHSIFSLCWSLFKMGQDQKAFELLKEGKVSAIDFKDNLYKDLFVFLDALYLAENKNEKLAYVFDRLEFKKLFSFLEGFALDAAEYHKRQNDFKSSSCFFDKVIYAQTQIQRGECLYEY
ncbi:tetratricopeptide repeat protein [Bacillus atrophaeus]|uniref:response regulator aspartate phosphatase n=1 Tax=Bacillus atrophaeus TaxID=1452 RepID=UPI002281AA69|nr:tetratricopeptide repeat protein [Bacillus atrophaeus]MCY9165902.1 tetratricopeptide repeat protein [Bacillus atrophaeus]